MAQLTNAESQLLEIIADMDGAPEAGAYNIRKNGAGLSRRSTDTIEIVPKTDKPGIDIIVKPGTKNETVFIPVIVSEAGLHDLVYNTFEIGEGADVTVVAGCGIHNDSADESGHDGIHHFIVRKGARLKYVEKHYGGGDGTGGRVLNPESIVELEEGAYADMDFVQIRGVDSAKRHTSAKLEKDSQLIVTEKMLTHGTQQAESTMEIELNGLDSSVQIISRSVAQDSSQQVFYPRVEGKTRCFGHVQCDAIIMDGSVIRAIPAITAYHSDAQLIHEAAIGKIAGEQIQKLMTLGLTEEEAEARILDGFLK